MSLDNDVDVSVTVASPQERAALGERLRVLLARDPRLALDTEFIRERTYTPVLEVVQIAANNGKFVAVVDVPALGGDLGTVGDLLLDPEVVKIVHSGGQDMEILQARLGAPPAPVYDTQIAASFAGWGTQIGYAALVQGLLGVRLSKEEGFADWSRRPLSPAMLAYAQNDVRYLCALHDKLSAILEERGRAGWADEQMRRLLDGAREVLAPPDLWRRVNGRSGLDSKNLAVLRELAMWRDEEAQRRNKPRRTVLKDEALVELARRTPQTASALLLLRGLPPGLGERTAEALAERIRRGLAVAPEDRPRVDSAPPLDDQGAALVELLSAVVRVRALEEDVSPSLLATQEELRALAGARRNPDFDGPVFRNWRGELIGNALREVLAGRLTVGWNAPEDRLSLIRKQNAVQ